MNAISISLAVNVPLGNDGLSGSTIRNASACVVGGFSSFGMAI